MVRRKSPSSRREPFLVQIDPRWLRWLRVLLVVVALAALVVLLAVLWVARGLPRLADRN